MRIVSLLASATEIVSALGLEDQLIGRSHECDYPPSILHLPICTSPKFDVTGSSSDIDRRVKEALQSGTSVYSVNAQLLDELRPDVIITQDQCEVCAVSLSDVQAVTAEMTCRPRIVTLNPNCLEDIWEDVRAIAAACGVAEKGELLLMYLRSRMRPVLDPDSPVVRPTVACIEWIEPMMAAGNWIPELVERAGGINLFGEAGKHSPWMTWEQLIERDPDVIVVMPCGFDLSRTKAEMSVLQNREGWQSLKAVRTGRVWAADGNAYFNRPGPRLMNALWDLAEAFHPGLVQFGITGIERVQ